MSQENLDAFRRGTEAISRGAVVDIPELVHPEAMRRFIADTEEMFEIFEISYTDVRDLGDRLVAIGSIRMRARGSGVEADVRSAAVVDYREGLLWRYKDYGEPRLALSAAGLRE